VTLHLVLFRLSPTLTDDDRDAFVKSFERALVDIPVIRRATVGRRVTFGAAYEAGMAHYDYMAVLEFETEADLRAYLAHPAHAELGMRFFASSDAVLVYDFEAVPGDRLRELVRRAPF
jgi:hypothetical protein